MEQFHQDEKSTAPGATGDHKWTGGGCHGAGFGILLILIGLLWLAAHAGWVEAGLFWPLALIVVGLWITIPSLRPRSRRQSVIAAMADSCCGRKHGPSSGK